jgi:hypothetical protein
MVKNHNQNEYHLAYRLQIKTNFRTTGNFFPFSNWNYFCLQNILDRLSKIIHLINFHKLF